MPCAADAKWTSGTASYSIQNDDTFYKICKYYNIAMDDLIDANPNMDPDNLIVGDTLSIPLTLQSTNCRSCSETYTIQENDTIYKLSQRFNIKTAALLEANPHINPDALLPGQIIYISKPWNKYSNNIYKIGFMYPTRWARINDLHYEGLDGFFRLSVINSDLDLEEISKSEAFHKLKPYGAHPDISSTIAAGCKASLVVPSQDQPMEMKKQAALIIQYPFSIEINGQIYSHLILWADTQHLQDIKNSMIILD